LSKIKVTRDEIYKYLVTYVFDKEPKANNAFGYRQVNNYLRDIGIDLSEKVIRRQMKELMLSPSKKTCRKYNSYMGTVGRVAVNILDRDFHAARPNEKWVTDITEFHLNGYKVYLSPIVDLYNGEVVSWNISTHPNMELVMTMLDKALNKLQDYERPIIHSDQGHHYQRKAYVDMLDNRECIQSMSKKGCSPDNAACEGFFGTLKTQFFYNNNYSGYTKEEFIYKLNDWIDWFNKSRAKQSLGGMSPVRYRVYNMKHVSYKIDNVTYTRERLVA
jgi:transposase InsO family protein